VLDRVATGWLTSTSVSPAGNSRRWSRSAGHCLAGSSARFDPETGTAVWVEEDYCRPPLAMERAAVLDAFFDDITIVEEDIDEAAGWSRIDDLPGLWEAVLGD